MKGERSLNNLNAIFWRDATKPAIPAPKKHKHPRNQTKRTTQKTKMELSHTEGTEVTLRFPVNEEQKDELLRLCGKRGNLVSKLNEKNSQILQKALEMANIFPERYPELVLSSTGNYMQATLPRPQYEQLLSLAHGWRMTDIEAAYRLIMNQIFRGEVTSLVTHKQE